MPDAIQELKLVLSLDSKAYQAGLKGAKTSLLGLSSAQVAFGMMAAQYAMRGIEAVVKQYKEYDDALDKLSYQVTDYNKVSRSMIQANSQTTASLRTVGEAAAVYGSRLKTTQAELTELTAVTAQYATDTGDSAGAIADSVAGLANRWEHDAGGIASALNKAGQMTGLTMSAMGAQMMDATPLAKALGMEFEELLAQAIEFKRAGVDFGTYVSLMEKNFEKFGGNATEAEREIKLITNTVRGFKTQAEAVGFLMEQGFSSRAAIELAEALRSQTQIELEQTEEEIRKVSESIADLSEDVKANLGWWDKFTIAMKGIVANGLFVGPTAQNAMIDQLIRQYEQVKKLSGLGYTREDISRLLESDSYYDLWEKMNANSQTKSKVAPGQITKVFPSSGPFVGDDLLDQLETQFKKFNIQKVIEDLSKKSSLDLWQAPSQTASIAPMMTDMNESGWTIARPTAENVERLGGTEKAAQNDVLSAGALESNNRFASVGNIMTDAGPHWFGSGLSKPAETPAEAALPEQWWKRSIEDLGEAYAQKEAQITSYEPKQQVIKEVNETESENKQSVVISPEVEDTKWASLINTDLSRVEAGTKRVAKMVKGNFREAFVSAAGYADNSGATIQAEFIPALTGAAVGMEEVDTATGQAAEGVTYLNEASEDTRSTWEKVAEWAQTAAEKMGIDSDLLVNNIWTGLARVGKESLETLGVDVDGLTAKVQDFFVQAKGYGFDLNSFWEWAQKGTGQTTAQIWNQTLDQMAKATGNFIMQASQMFASGTVDWKELFGGLWRGILASSITALAKMVAEWIAGLQIIAQAKAWLETMPGVGAAIAIGALAVGGIAMLASAKSQPALAEGGLVTGPTNALIGEAGPEAVFPLEKLRDYGLPYGRDGAGASGGNASPIVNITVNNPILNNRTSEKDVRDFMDRMGRQIVRKGGAFANSYS